MISIKDYAKENGISYEAVRRQVKQYKSELEDHIQVSGKTQFLDEVAVAFLNGHRSKNPIVTYDKDTSIRIKELEQENRELLKESKEAYKMISALENWKSENSVAISSAQANLKLLEEKEETISTMKDLLETANKSIETLREEKTAAVQEVREELGQERQRAEQEKQRADQLQAKLDQEHNKTFGQKLKALFAK